MFEDLPETDAALAALRQAEVGAARAAVAQWDAALAVWESTPSDFRVGRQPQALAEIGAALGLSQVAAGQRLCMGEALLSWPLLRTLLLGGRLGVPHALAAVDEVDALADQALAGRVLQAVLAADGRLGWQGTPARLRSALQMTAVLLDPVGAARRREQRQAADSRVRLRARADGMADLTATGAAEKLSAADRLLDLLSARCGPSDERTLGQRQVDALVGALVRAAGAAVPLELQLEVPVRLAVAGLVAQDDPDRTVLPEPLVVVTDLGPELLDRLQVGARPPADDQEQAAAPRSQGTSREATDSDDEVGPEEVSPVAVGHQARAPEDALKETADREVGTERAAPGGAERSGRRGNGPLDLVGPAAGATGRRRPHGGLPLLVGHGPLDLAGVLDLLTDPDGLPVGLSGVQVRRVLVDHTGQSVAVDARAVPLARLLADPRGLLPALLAHLPDPPPRHDAYRPTAAQERVVRARDRLCTFPGCGRHPRRADLDHRVRFPDGPTSTANLHPLCRRHHRLKHDGWRCVRHLDGSTTWTSPRGQVLRTAPS